MPISKYFTYVGSALLVLLFVSNAYLADDEADLRFDGSLYESALYAPRQEETRVTTELRFTRDVTPAVSSRACRCGPAALALLLMGNHTVL